MRDLIQTDRPPQLVVTGTRVRYLQRVVEIRQIFTTPNQYLIGSQKDFTENTSMGIQKPHGSYRHLESIRRDSIQDESHFIGIFFDSKSPTP
jgi:hypothetical protein